MLAHEDQVRINSRNSQIWFVGQLSLMQHTKTRMQVQLLFEFGGFQTILVTKILNECWDSSPHVASRFSFCMILLLLQFITSSRGVNMFTICRQVSPRAHVVKLFSQNFSELDPELNLCYYFCWVYHFLNLVYTFHISVELRVNIFRSTILTNECLHHEATIIENFCYDFLVARYLTHKDT